MGIKSSAVSVAHYGGYSSICVSPHLLTLESTYEGDLTRDDVLDDFTLYWLTNRAISAGSFLLGTSPSNLRRRQRLHPGCRERVS
jgi:hypothetical protein